MSDPEEKYCLYLRKSRADREAELHGQMETLARHELTLTELAKRLSLPVRAVYREIVSGETIAARPEMTRLLADVEAGAWNGVLVMEVERLARGDTIDQGIVAQAFRLSGTKIITPCKIYDPEDEFDEEYFEFGLFMSRREYKTISRRINRGRIASVREGKYISPVAPYGYKRVRLPEGKGYMLKPEPEQAAVVRLIYDLYLHGRDGEEMGSRRIALYLDSLGIRPMKKDAWSAATIRDMLKNEVYTGKSVWQKRREVKTVKNGKVTKSRPTAKEYISVPGLHEALVSEETFAAAGRLMAQRAHTTSTVHAPLRNPLSGLVYCAKCGALMTRQGTGKKLPYSSLKCPNPYCDNISAPVSLIEDALSFFLQEWLNRYRVLLQEDSPEQNGPQADLLRRTLATARKKLEELRGRLQKTYELLESGVYSEAVFRERNGRLAEEIREAEAAVRQLEAGLAEETRAAEALRQPEAGLAEKTRAAEALRQPEAGLEDGRKEAAALSGHDPRSYELAALYMAAGTPAQKNRILRQLLQKAEYLKTERSAKGHLQDGNFTLHVYPRLPS